MAIARHGVLSTVSSSSQSTASVDLPASIPVGALVIVGIGTNTTSADMTVPTGWRSISEFADGAYRQLVIARFRQQGDSDSVSIPLGVSSEWAAVAGAWTGVYWQDIENASLSVQVPFQAWNTTSESGTDTTLATAGTVTQEYDGTGWSVGIFGLRSATTGITSATTSPGSGVMDERLDVSSSGTTKAVIALYDDDNAPFTDGANSVATITSSASTAEKMMWYGTLRPAEGPAFWQHATSTGLLDSSPDIAIPADAPVGSLLVIALATGTVSTATLSGWTKATVDDVGVSLHVFHRRCTGAEGTTVAVSLGSSEDWAASCQVFLNVDTSDPFIVTDDHTESGTDTSMTTDSITNTDPLAWGVAACASTADLSSITTTNGNVRIVSDLASGAANLLWAHSNGPTAISTNTSWTFTGSSTANRAARVGFLRPAVVSKTVAVTAPAATSSITGTSEGGITFVNGATTSNAAGGVSDDLTVDKPTGTAQNDVMVAAIYKGADSVHTLNSVPSGWTIINTATDTTNLHATMYYKVAGGSEPSTYTWGVSGTGIWGVGIFTFRGVDTADPITASAKQTYTTTDPATAPNVTSITPGSVVLTFRASRDDSATEVTHTSSDAGTEAADWGNDGGATTRNGAVYYNAVAPGTYGYTVDSSGSVTNGVMYSVVLATSQKGKLRSTAPAVTANVDGEVTDTNEGTLSAAAPAVTADINGAVEVSGDISGITAPAVTADVNGYVWPTGPVAATAPAATADINGAAVGAGIIAATAPAATADVNGAAEVTGDISGITAPAVTADFDGAVFTSLSGDLDATAPAVTADFDGATPPFGPMTVTAPAATADVEADIPPSIMDATAPAATGTGTVEVTVSGVMDADVPEVMVTDMEADLDASVIAEATLGATAPTPETHMVTGAYSTAELEATTPAASATGQGNVAAPGVLSIVVPYAVPNIDAATVVDGVLGATAPAATATVLAETRPTGPRTKRVRTEQRLTIVQRR